MKSLATPMKALKTTSKTRMNYCHYFLCIKYFNFYRDVDFVLPSELEDVLSDQDSLPEMQDQNVSSSQNENESPDVNESTNETDSVHPSESNDITINTIKGIN